MTSPELQVPTAAAGAEAPVKLPVDIRTLLIGVRSRRRLLLTFVVASLVLGAAGAKLLGKKSYETSTVLLYRPPPTGSTLPAGEVDENDTPTLLTQMDMVKIDKNLEEVRARLKLKESTEALGSSIKVDVPINSSLMTIVVTTNDPEKAAAIANTTRQVFLEEQLNIQHALAASKVRDLVARQDKVQAELHVAEQNLKDFTIKNHVVDLDKEAGWYLQQLINTELVYEEAVGQDNASQLQQQNIGKIAGKLEEKVRAEEAQVNGEPGAPVDPAAQTMPTDDAIRGRVADLKMKQIDMERAKTLADDGIYSKKDYEKAKAAYEQERFLLYKDSPSAALYKEMTLRELDVQLNHISDQQKVAHLREAVAHVHERLDSLPLVQRDYLALSREVAIRATEREHIDQLLGVARRENESQTYGFSLVSEAAPPLLPLKSNRKLVFAALFVVGSGCGIVLALLLELTDRRLRSVGDARAKLSPEVLAGFQYGALGVPESPDESLRLMHRLRRAGAIAGSRLLVVSPTDGEGAPEVAQLLAQTYAKAGDSVLLVDARFRNVPEDVPAKLPSQLQGWRLRLFKLLEKLKPELLFPPVRNTESSLTYLASATRAQGLSDMLARDFSEASAPVQLGDNIRLIPAGRSASPEMLLSHRLPGCLDAVSTSTDLTIVNTSPLLGCPDATFLASTVPCALLVVAAGKMTAETIGQGVKALTEAGIKILGVVVTNIAVEFMEAKTA